MHPILARLEHLAGYLALWCAIGVLEGVVLTRQGLSWPEALVHVLPPLLIYAFVCLSAFYVCRAMPLTTSGVPGVLTASAAAASVAAVLWLILNEVWLGTLESMPGLAPITSRFRTQVPFLFTVSVMLFLLVLSVHYVVLAFEAFRTAERQQFELQVLTRDAELHALRAQVDHRRSRRLQFPLSGQCHRPGVSRSGRAGHWSTASLHVRDLRARHQARCPAGRGRVRDARERAEGDAGAYSRQSRLRRVVQATAMTTIRGSAVWLCVAFLSSTTGRSFSPTSLAPIGSARTTVPDPGGAIREEKSTRPRASCSMPVGDRPVVVLTRGNLQGDAPALLAGLSRNSRQTVVAGAGHEIHLFAPAVVMQAIQDVAMAAGQQRLLPQRP